MELKIFFNYKMVKDTKESFIKKAILKHGNLYDYEEVVYVNSQTKVKIKCPLLHIFEQRPYCHLQGQGCPQCKGGIRKTQEKFIEQVIKIHGNTYDYSRVIYVTKKIKIKIICKKHGEFGQLPDDHIRGCGCPKCGNVGRRTTDEFIEQGIKIHGDTFDYSKVDYKGSLKNICILCEKHGEFNQTASSHLRGYGCPRCNCSNGEKKICEILKKYKIQFEIEHRFKECKYKLPLPFDIYIKSLNLCIEYDGKQHFEAIEFFGGEENLKNVKMRDEIKNNYCKENRIILLRISYSEPFENYGWIIFSVIKYIKKLSEAFKKHKAENVKLLL